VTVYGDLKEQVQALAAAPGMVSFSLKGWDVTALGNAQGQRTQIHSCVLFSF
jgi:hypothetical protein